MSEKVILFKRDGDKPFPIKVTATIPGEWPGYDDDDQQIFINTHFKTEQEAWDSVMANAKAHLSLASARVVNLRNELLQAERGCANAAILLTDAAREYEKFCNSKI